MLNVLLGINFVSYTRTGASIILQEATRHGRRLVQAIQVRVSWRPV